MCVWTPPHFRYLSPGKPVCVTHTPHTHAHLHAHPWLPGRTEELRKKERRRGWAVTGSYTHIHRCAHAHSWLPRLPLLKIRWSLSQLDASVHAMLANENPGCRHSHRRVCRERVCVPGYVRMCGYLFFCRTSLSLFLCVCQRMFPAGSDVLLMLVLWGKRRDGRTSDCCSHCETGTHTGFMSAKI